ncbi:MAG: helix-turn-helix transcriptional regulator [Euryarchaeota archaeon]|nr:helix-turn-helix transcriptional regulator [Euryarchaeota archaeon]
METLGRKWSVLVIGIVGNKARTRFHVLQAALPGISPRTLTDRLRELEEQGIVERQAYPEIPPRVEYSLTRQGEILRDALIPLLEWAAARVR